MRKVLAAFLALLSLQCYATDYEEWMKELPDEMLICNLSVPGSHDSGTKGFSFSGETQKLTIREQLEAGVRAFDLRPGVLDGQSLRIYHSSYLHGDESLQEVFTTLTDFLNAHPSECLFICMKQECGEDATWQSLVYDCLSSFEAYFVTLKTKLRMSDMRGKILLMSRNSYADKPFGTYFTSGWADNTTSTNYIKGKASYKMTVRIQDIYDNSNGLETKKEDLVKLMDECRKGNTNRLFINHTSGYTGQSVFSTSYLADCAAQCNKVVVEYLSTNEGPVGLIMSDYVAKDEVTSGLTKYATCGKQLIDALILNSQQTAARLYTGIDDVAAAPSSIQMYDLTGRPASHPHTRGIYIQNGRKYVK